MSLTVTEILKSVAQGEVLAADTAESVMHALMTGEITPIQTAGILSAMAVRGEAVSEIVGFARGMRGNGLRIEAPEQAVDTCGTGGDGGSTFNISTAAAIVCAAGGVPVAKHGNRAVSSRSGSADVLAALGARIDLTPDEASACLAETNLCFLFAQTFHPAMKYAAEPRKQLGFRTIFNILGPLTNPAGAKRQVIGVFRPDLVEKVAYALVELGTEHALVVHGAGGIDEISLEGETLVAEVKNGVVQVYTVQPSDFDVTSAPVSAIAGGDANVNAGIIKAVLSGELGPCRDVVLLNAGAVLYVSGKAATIRDGVQQAARLIDTGKAARTLLSFVGTTHQYSRREVAQ